MKRFWLVLLSLGLVMAFSASVFAADVKFSGSFYAAGMYMDKTSLKDDDGTSSAFYYQRLRVNMEFVATPYLKLVTRFDAMERIWGGKRVAGDTAATPWGGDPTSYGTREENENIAFDYAYIWYVSKIGLWQVGILSDNVWGTTFGNNDEPEGQIHWTLVKMPFIVGGKIVKISENSSSAVVQAPYGTQSDVDQDKYLLYGIYNFKGNNYGGQVGLLGYYVRAAQAKPEVIPAPTMGFKTEAYGLIPYAKANIGPVAIEAEGHYQWGKARDWNDSVARDDIDLDSWYAYVDALADFGMFYVGLTGAFVSGDDNPGDDKVKNNLDAGRDWNPLLILFNYDRTYWGGGLAGWNNTDANNAMTNALFGMIRAGVRPVKDLDIMMAVAYAEADKKSSSTYAATLNDEYGWEVDVTATYKITNNLSYMLGVGYLITGDYYEGSVAGQDTQDNFLVLNKLTLTF